MNSLSKEVHSSLIARNLKGNAWQLWRSPKQVWTCELLFYYETVKQTLPPLLLHSEDGHSWFEQAVNHLLGTISLFENILSALKSKYISLKYVVHTKCGSGSTSDCDTNNNFLSVRYAHMFIGHNVLSLFTPLVITPSMCLFDTRTHVHMCVCMYTCMYGCIYVCVHVCMSTYTSHFALTREDTYVLA